MLSLHWYRCTPTTSAPHCNAAAPFHLAGVHGAGSCTLQPGQEDSSHNPSERLGLTEVRSGTADAHAPGAMSFEYAAGTALAVLLSVYLVYALLRPERF